MSFKPIDPRRDEFRKYLERTGALEAISKAFIKLYECTDRPENSVEFLRKNLGDTILETDTIQHLKRELEDSRNEVAQLIRTIGKLETQKTAETDLTIKETINEAEDTGNNEIISKSLTNDEPSVVALVDNKTIEANTTTTTATEPEVVVAVVSGGGGGEDGGGGGSSVAPEPKPTCSKAIDDTVVVVDSSSNVASTSSSSSASKTEDDSTEKTSANESEPSNKQE